MTERKYCGFDINGWRDVIARNWSTRPGDEEEIGPTSLLESGPLTVVVRVGDAAHGAWVGGRQADLAPHGRGGGWGQVGTDERRHSVRALLEGRVADARRFAAPFEVAGRVAIQNIVAIDDTPESTELFRERLLGGLATARLRNSMLVWRPVLAALYAIETGLLAEELTVGVVSQAPHGLSIQRLRLRHADGRGDRVLAPERRQAAQILESVFGYADLVRRARDLAIGPDGLNARTAHRAQAASTGRLALGLPFGAEVLQDMFGNWEMLDLSSAEVAPSSRVPQKIPAIDDCDVVLIETLSEGPVRDAITEAVSASTHSDVHALPPSAVAEGALFGAKRLGGGDPVYFDFLPRLSTIVFGSEGSANFDLIDASETLEAGRVYRSPEPASFAIPAGHGSVSVYLRKEAEPHPRVATVTLDKPLKAPTPVSLWVEQTPAAGRARIVLDAPALGRHFTVDWEEAQDDARDWVAIIAALETPPPSIPERLILKSGMRPWEDSERADGMFSLLAAEATRSRRDWESLAAKLAARPFGEYCISSDGEIPKDVPTEWLAQLDQLTDHAIAINRERLQMKDGLEQEDNATLKFLTWQFRRCPAEVTDWLIECVESRDLPMFSHPFILNHMSWTLVYQGLGRIAQNETTERRILKLLLSTSVKDWSWRNESACVAFLLSRSDSAPMLLDRSDVERLVHRTVIDFKANKNTEYNKFYYAPFLLAGLLRWRLKEKRGLLLGEDPLADDLARVIDEATLDLKSRRRPNLKFEKKKTQYLPILKDLRDELGGKGGNPSLLLDIYNAGKE